MVNPSSPSRPSKTAKPFRLQITVFVQDKSAQDTLLAALTPEVAAINSKRVTLQVKSSQNQIHFHLAAQDITALRAAATSLIRLYTVADGVQQLTVNPNG